MKIVGQVGNYSYERDLMGWNHTVEAGNFRAFHGDDNYFKNFSMTIGQPSKEVAEALALGRRFTITIEFDPPL